MKRPETRVDSFAYWLIFCWAQPGWQRQAEIMDMQAPKTADLYTYNKVTIHEVTELIALMDAERVSLREADLNLHARDQSFHKAHPPEVIVWPITTEEVSRVLKFANEARIPVTA